MGAGGQLTETGSSVYTWEDVQRHCSRNDQWLVIDQKVYNITKWAERHPGGFRVIHHYAGEDATEAFTAFHPDKKFVQLFLKPLLIGELVETEPSQDRQKNDVTRVAHEVMEDARDMAEYRRQEESLRAEKRRLQERLQGVRDTHHAVRDTYRAVKITCAEKKKNTKAEIRSFELKLDQLHTQHELSQLRKRYDYLSGLIINFHL
ncbi:acyl-CoA 6-desaturase isoform X2 [Entelurus aequoreus]|nr:acyl-CoA 6-desaturase isoform X2 [Entelurus aequoreus]